MKVIKVNKDSFNDEVLNSKIPVIVDFNADWCGPCKMLGPILENVAENCNDVKFVSVNIDDEDDLADAVAFSAAALAAFLSASSLASRASS